MSTSPQGTAESGSPSTSSGRTITNINISSGRVVSVVTSNSEVQADIAKLTDKLPRSLKHHYKDNYQRFDSSAISRTRMPFMYAANPSSEHQRLDEMNKLVELISEYYEDINGIGGTTRLDVGRAIRSRINHIIDNDTTASDIISPLNVRPKTEDEPAPNVGLAVPGAHTPSGEYGGTDHGYGYPSQPGSPRTFDQRWGSPSHQNDEHRARGHSPGSLDAIGRRSIRRPTPQAMQRTTPLPSTLSSDKVSEVSRSLLRDIHKSVSWTDGLLDPTTTSVYAWRRRVFSQLRSVPKAIATLEGNDQLEDIQDGILCAILEKTFSQTLITRLRQSNTMENATAYKLLHWAVEQCTAYSDDRRTKLSMEIQNMRWNGQDNPTTFILKFEAKLNELMEFLDTPWTPYDKWTALTRALPGDENSLFSAIFYHWHKRIENGDYYLSEDNFEEILRDCKWQAVSSLSVNKEKKSMALVAQDKSVSTMSADELAAAAIAGQPVCWACKQVGHVWRKCTDNKAKDEFNQRRKKSGGEAKDATKAFMAAATAAFQAVALQHSGGKSSKSGTKTSKLTAEALAALEQGSSKSKGKKDGDEDNDSTTESEASYPTSQ